MVICVGMFQVYIFFFDLGNRDDPGLTALAFETMFESIKNVKREILLIIGN